MEETVVAQSSSLLTRDGQKLPRPDEIAAYLEQYVIGQHDAKKVLANAVYNHYKRIIYSEMDDSIDGIQLAKSNVMMMGPTGVGKTYIASTVAKLLDVPFASSDATSLIASGGRDVEVMLQRILAAANGDVKKAERGIIYIDEIDKLARQYSKVGESIQQGLLKIIEGTTYTLPVEGGRRIDLNTTNIMYIVGGAFVGLEAHVQSRVFAGTTLHEASELFRMAQPDDIAKFGLIPEFIGRLPVIVVLDALSKDDLIEILTVPKNAIVPQFQKLFALDGVELVFDKPALNLIADKALARKTGARGLRSILEESLREVMYAAPGEKNLRKVMVTKDVIEKKGDAVFHYIHAREEVELSEPPTKAPK